MPTCTFIYVFHAFQHHDGKCSVSAHMHLKFSKSANMIKTNFPQSNKYWHEKMQKFVPISKSIKKLKKKNPPETVIGIFVANFKLF